jgi:hypothetical protein
MTETDRLDGSVSEPEKATVGLRAILVRLYYGKSDDFRRDPDDVGGRPLVCTPFKGAYGPAGWVICVEGSPPRGTLLVLTSESRGMRVSGRNRIVTIYPACYCEIEACKRLRDVERLYVVQRFVDLCLAGRTEAFTIPGLPARQNPRPHLGRAAPSPDPTPPVEEEGVARVRRALRRGSR